jgi:hypothetical protein
MLKNAKLGNAGLIRDQLTLMLEYRCPPCGLARCIPTEYIFYCKREILFLSSSKILTPIPLSPWRVCTPRLCCGGRTDSPGGKTREIELPSYSKICTLCVSLSSASSVDLYGVSLSTLVKPNARLSGTASVQFGTGREKMPVPELTRYPTKDTQSGTGPRCRMPECRCRCPATVSKTECCIWDDIYF